MNVYELNIDGLVGPTHNYAGLAPGNVASISNAKTASNPQQAALQGIKKMRFLYELGLKQAVFPPHQRPNLKLLYALGFTGTPSEQINKASKKGPSFLSACYSASSMWAANAATVSASADTEDSKVHFTAANLVSNLHRFQEADFYPKLLSSLFANTNYFHHHSVLPRSVITGDEGAANHNRLCESHAQPAVNLFVYGRAALNPLDIEPSKYPARQTKEACEAIARSHLLNPQKVIFACQNPKAIDQGVFHNDVISVANEYVFLVHQEAFYDQRQILDQLNSAMYGALNILEISKEQLSIKEAVDSYIFNSQLITLPHQKGMILLAPFECQNNARVKNCVEQLISDSNNPIQSVFYVDLNQSMRNGGGPACLRLRVPLNEEELNAMHQGVLITNELLNELEIWIMKHYRTELVIADLADPQLMNESLQALDELSQILKLGSIYPFQSEFTF